MYGKYMATKNFDIFYIYTGFILFSCLQCAIRYWPETCDKAKNEKKKTVFVTNNQV